MNGQRYGLRARGAGNPKLRIGILGHCPICEGEFKTKDGNMVHHGYRRPGDGQIHGDCYAVNMPAYELSPMACESYRAELEFQKKGLEAALAKLDSGETTKISFSKMARVDGRMVFLHEEFFVGQTGWLPAFRRRCSELTNEIHGLSRAIERMTKRIEAWVLKPLREVTEAVAEAEAKAVRDARAAERQAKRDAASAKAAALQAKRDIREDARVEHIEKFVESLRATKAAASRGEILDTVSATRVLVNDFQSKKNYRKFGYIYLYQYVSEQSDKNLFVELGLARRDPDTGTTFFDV